jgi:two-component system, chemotaxis family, chemotaxis protein CheY
MNMEPQEPAFNLSNVEVVIVDDCPIMVKLLGMMLSSMDIKKLHCTTNPERALEAVAKYRPHLVITDLLMDTMDGLTVAKAIRFSQDDELRCTPIFVLSGFTDKEHVIQARDAGVNEVLTKPVSTRIIHQRICKLIERPPKFIETASYFGPDRQPSRSSLSRTHYAPGDNVDRI